MTPNSDESFGGGGMYLFRNISFNGFIYPRVVIVCVSWRGLVTRLELRRNLVEHLR